MKCLVSGSDSKRLPSGLHPKWYVKLFFFFRVEGLLSSYRVD